MTDTATLSEFAVLLGVQPSYVTKLKQQGRLVLDGKRVVVEASLKRIRETDSGRRPDVKDRHVEHRGSELPLPVEDEEATEPAGPEDPAPPIGSRAYWERKDREEIARMREMQRRKMEGDLIPKEAVDYWVDDFCATVISIMENLPDRLTPAVVHLNDKDDTRMAIVDATDEAISEIREKMSRCKKERADGIVGGN
jgi:hypothetical protein